MNKARDECGCTPRLPKPPAIYARCLRRYVNVYSRERVQSLHIHRLMSDFNHLLSASQECSAPSAPDTCLWLQRQPLPGLLLRHSTWRSNLNLSKCCNYSMTNFLVPPKREKVCACLKVTVINKLNDQNHCTGGGSVSYLKCVSWVRLDRTGSSGNRRHIGTLVGLYGCGILNRPTDSNVLGRCKIGVPVLN